MNFSASDSMQLRMFEEKLHTIGAPLIRTGLSRSIIRDPKNSTENGCSSQQVESLYPSRTKCIRKIWIVDEAPDSNAAGEVALNHLRPRGVHNLGSRV